MEPEQQVRVEESLAPLGRALSGELLREQPRGALALARAPHGGLEGWASQVPLGLEPALELVWVVQLAPALILILLILAVVEREGLDLAEALAQV
jgi:hypothetical protein